MKKFSLISCCLLLALTSQAQPTATYYQSIDGKHEAALKAALHDVIAPHTELGYSALWGAYEKVDYLPETNSQGQHKVMDYYSTNTYYFTGNGSAVGGMNKEHVAPQSWWTGGTGRPVGNDLIQVIPSDATANNRKGNYPLGVVDGAASYSNPRMKTGRDKNNDWVFEPCDEYKGDFARIFFYVATCYPDESWQSRSDVNVSFKKEDYPTLKSDILPMLLEWHNNDPVCEWEITRNDRVFKVQGNRNPFIDYPSLANYIWGEKNTTDFDLSRAILYSFDETEITPPEPELEVPFCEWDMLAMELTLSQAEIIEDNIFTTNSDGDITFTSSDEVVATVDEDGVVYGHSAGTAVITGTTAQTDKYKSGSASYTLTITEDPVDGIAALTQTSRSKAIYTLTGQRVSQIEQPGIYIIDGKKVLIQ